ncbi:ABC-type transport auxiliary lipoprotein family protein [Parerythrobacter jejuensis]|uniref:ABC transporter n=1 Tax=Parerythrobacter jejuensis TaxID=795812 RepID=A0A845ARL3_9SPHN|nr:ABC-type transport auxiliary lipoprotein family protein [Parerythrobacter jejuensis]MXP31555.1 ABC transporter [Parerythrobacter jejuensis]
MKTAIRIALAGAATLGLSACISLGSEPPPSLLTLTAANGAPAGSGSTGTNENALSVIEPSAPQRLSVTRVPVQVDDATIAYLQDAVWVERPTRLFRRLLSETIRTRTGRVVIDGFDPTFATSQQLRGSLVEFGYDARSSSVIVRYDAMRDGENDTVVTQRFESVVSGVPAEAGPVGDALNRAANDVAGQVADWVS